MSERTPMPNIKKLAKARNKSLTYIAVKCEVSPEAMSQYISGKIKPKISTIIQMAKILNTSTDYLLGITDNPVPAGTEINEEEWGLINNYRILNREDKLRSSTYIQNLVDLREDIKK